MKFEAPIIIEILNNQNLAEFIAQIAEIHSQSYSPDHFTASFCIDKLIEYNSALVLASDVSVIARDRENVIGFVIGGCNVSDGVRVFTTANRFWIIRQLIKHPKVLFFKMVGLFISRIFPIKPSKASFRLLSIATRPGTQSKGIGMSMLDFLEKELLRRSIVAYGLSVKIDNVRAINFYEKNGFNFEKMYLDSSYYIKKLKPLG